MRRAADSSAVVAGEDVVPDPFGATELRLGRLALALVAPPQLVVLREALLEGEVREQRGDVGLAGPVVACPDRDALAEELLDGRREGTVLG